MATITLQKDYIVFKVNSRFNYDVSLKQILRDGLEKWLFHLREKNWFNSEVENKFIKLVEDYDG